MPNEQDVLPWYRQFWPWFLFGLPASVVVAGITTVWIAIDGADDLVADDYYKSGLAINQQLEKRETAAQLGLKAEVSVDASGALVVLNQSYDAALLTLTLSHPLEADRDTQVNLRRIDARHFSAPLAALPAGRWHWILESDTDRPWRLDGELVVAP